MLLSSTRFKVGLGILIFWLFVRLEEKKRKETMNVRSDQNEWIELEVNGMNIFENKPK